MAHKQSDSNDNGTSAKVIIAKLDAVYEYERTRYSRENGGPPVSNNAKREARKQVMVVVFAHYLDLRADIKHSSDLAKVRRWLINELANGSFSGNEQKAEEWLDQEYNRITNTNAPKQTRTRPIADKPKLVLASPANNDMSAERSNAEREADILDERLAEVPAEKLLAMCTPPGPTILTTEDIRMAFEQASFEDTLGEAAALFVNIVRSDNDEKQKTDLTNLVASTVRQYFIEAAKIDPEHKDAGRKREEALGEAETWIDRAIEHAQAKQSHLDNKRHDASTVEMSLSLH